MKKYVAMLLALAMALSLAGCGGKDKDGDRKDPKPMETVEDYDPTDDWSEDDWETVRYSRDVKTDTLDATLSVEYEKGEGRNQFMDMEVRSFDLPFEPKVEAAAFDPATVDIRDVQAATGLEDLEISHHWDYNPQTSDVKAGVEEFWYMEYPLHVYIDRDVSGELHFVSIEPYEYWDGEEGPVKSAWESVQKWIGDFSQWSWSEGDEDVIIDGYRYRYYPDDMHMDIRPVTEQSYYQDSYDAEAYITARGLFDGLVATDPDVVALAGDWLELDEEAGIASGAVGQDLNRFVELSVVSSMEDKPFDDGHTRSRYFSASVEYENGNRYDEFEVPRESMHSREFKFSVDDSSSYMFLNEGWDFFGTSERECRDWLEGKLSELGCDNVEWSDGQDWDAVVMSGSSMQGTAQVTVTPLPDLVGYVGFARFGLYNKEDGEWAVELRVQY